VERDDDLPQRIAEKSRECQTESEGRTFKTRGHKVFITKEVFGSSFINLVGINDRAKRIDPAIPSFMQIGIRKFLEGFSAELSYLILDLVDL